MISEKLLLESRLELNGHSINIDENGREDMRKYMSSVESFFKDFKVLL